MRVSTSHHKYRLNGSRSPIIFWNPFHILYLSAVFLIALIWKRLSYLRYDVDITAKCRHTSECKMQALHRNCKMLPISLQHVAHKLATCCPQSCKMLPTILQHVAHKLATCCPQSCKMLPTILQHVAHKLATCCPQACNMLPTTLQNVAHNLATCC